MPLRFGSLFAGIGGFDLGFERAGMECAWQVEIDPYCQRVLKKHWPNVPLYPDIVKFCRRGYDCEPEKDENGEVELDTDGSVFCPRCDGQEFGECECVGTDELVDTCGSVDVVVGGFPCQDVSQIGRRAGITGSRSGLWKEFHRVAVRELGSRYIVVENVSGLRDRGIETVIGDLADSGYRVRWESLCADTVVGAPHKRERVYIVADLCRAGLEGHAGNGEGGGQPGWIPTQQDRSIGARCVRPRSGSERGWTSDAGILRVDHGIPCRMDRIKCCGNAVVPQMAEALAQVVIDMENERIVNEGKGETSC